MAAWRFNMREGPDSMVKWTRLFALVAWVIAFAVFFIISEAKPRYDTMFQRIYDNMFYGAWDMNMLKNLYYLMIPLVVICGIGLFINSARHRRKRDTYNKSFIVFGVLSLIGIILLAISG